MEILRIENLSFKYPAKKEYALENISLSFPRGSFNLICGCSGSGKTTLLKLLKPELAPNGEKSGAVFYNDINIFSESNSISASKIGFVMQNPDNQIVTDKVWRELAFGLENIGESRNTMKAKIGETASYFGIEGWFNKNTYELSGGQKQLLNLAAVTVMEPDILILDEPTSRLDPIAASEFFTMLQRMNRELSVTVIIAEHRLDELLPFADSLTVIDNGKIVASGSPKPAAEQLKNISRKHPILSAFPAAFRIHNALNGKGTPPLTAREGQDFLKNNFNNKTVQTYPPKKYISCGNPSIELKNIYFRYERNSEDVIRDTSLTAYEGERFFLLGGNGAGKTTLLNIIAGLEKPYHGKLKLFGKSIRDYSGNSLYKNCITMLPQAPQNIFIRDTVYEDMSDILKSSDSKKDLEIQIRKISEKLGIQKLLECNPLDLSGGELQKCAIAKILLTNPRIMLLDEPTKGLDAYDKQKLSEIISLLAKENITVITVTHDIEFAAENADRCGLLFNGELLSDSDPCDFFGRNAFYTTAASRISRFMFKNAVTVSQVAEMCLKNEKKNV